MRSGLVRVAGLAALLGALGLAGCGKPKVDAEPFPGWHSADCSTVLGRLVRVAPSKPDASPVWLVRFGLPTDPYHGELAVTPPSMLDGFSGGETVQVRGVVRPDLHSEDSTATWMEVRSIKMWSDYR
jgi:hypothetical protein